MLTSTQVEGTTLRIVSSHSKANRAAEVLAKAAAFLRALLASAEHLTDEQRWYEILSYAVRKYLNGRKLRAPPRLAPARFGSAVRRGGWQRYRQQDVA